MLVCVFCCCWKLEKNPTKITFFPAPAETAKHQGSLWSAWRLRCGRTSPDPCATTRIGIPKCSRRCCTAREPGKFFGQFLGVFGIWLKGKKKVPHTKNRNINEMHVAWQWWCCFVWNGLLIKVRVWFFVFPVDSVVFSFKIRYIRWLDWIRTWCDLDLKNVLFVNFVWYRLQVEDSTLA